LLEGAAGYNPASQLDRLNESQLVERVILEVHRVLWSHHQGMADIDLRLLGRETSRPISHQERPTPTDCLQNDFEKDEEKERRDMT